MSSVELFFLNMGLSYTLSKVAAYLLFPLLGLLVWLIIKKWIKRKGLRITALMVLCVGFFFGYFLQHPIYEGDFSNNSTPVLLKSELDNIKTDKLVVITIPNCPFCQESISRMRVFQERHPKVKIEYRVCVNDSLAQDAVELYRKRTGNNILVSQATDGKKLASVADMFFPTFVLVTKSGKMKWSNDNFGAGALDEVVAAFEK
ncbi:MAG: hypothetical protein A3D31_12590 [Candidatus Fluviicola riflensis]|nr:MAG: hypothetical protein CHH17_17030 [Candidatus Fluviicola riflensis]OGS77821.1 MAG: hypothetical protein A3D31_12590 [Candidatus Fluviicola riflensis]OGS84886.1 MAG: hypothetical protein A2724_09525 [Fluviicola sp. RIFCSPHIGHO2_01_FULL_43_53]OGS89158.1 MAG: hypothetical protein A3E30_03830 [Fluviicola sp. RIFCSPHIGHO2_12_FULL_43_24]